MKPKGSADGQNWATIGQVKGHGNAISMNNYFAVDNLAGIIPAGTLYYRLNQVDFNGVSEYSMIRAVNLHDVVTATQTYPNPTNNVLNIDWSNASNQDATLKIYNMAGSAIYSANVTGAGLMHKQIDMSAFPVGTYSVQVISGTSVTNKMVVKN